MVNVMVGRREPVRIRPGSLGEAQQGASGCPGRKVSPSPVGVGGSRWPYSTQRLPKLKVALYRQMTSHHSAGYTLHLPGGVFCEGVGHATSTASGYPGVHAITVDLVLRPSHGVGIPVPRHRYRTMGGSSTSTWTPTATGHTPVDGTRGRTPQHVIGETYNVAQANRNRRPNPAIGHPARAFAPFVSEQSDEHATNATEMRTPRSPRQTIQRHPTGPVCSSIPEGPGPIRLRNQQDAQDKESGWPIS